MSKNHETHAYDFRKGGDQAAKKPAKKKAKPPTRKPQPAQKKPAPAAAKPAPAGDPAEAWGEG